MKPSRRHLAAIGLAAITLLPAVIAALAGVDLNLFYGIVVLAACAWLAPRTKRLDLLWLLLGAVALALLPYPLWVQTDAAGAIAIKWSQAVYERHPWYYVAAFVVNAILLLCAFRLAAGRWPTSKRPESRAGS